MWYTVFFELTFELLTIAETVYRKAIHLQQFLYHTLIKNITLTGMVENLAFLLLLKQDLI